MLRTAPDPVMTAQPMMEVTSVSTSSSMGTTTRSDATRCSAQVDAEAQMDWLRQVAGMGGRWLRAWETGGSGDSGALRSIHVVKTRSPSLTWLTSRPLAATTPVDSWPSSAGSFDRCSSGERRIWWSWEWQMPLANSLTRTWSGAGSGRTTSSTTRGLRDSTRIAARDFVGMALPRFDGQDLRHVDHGVFR